MTPTARSSAASWCWPMVRNRSPRIGLRLVSRWGGSDETSADRVGDQLTAAIVSVGVVALSGKWARDSVLENFSNPRMAGQIAILEEIDQDGIEIAIAELLFGLPHGSAQAEREPHGFLLLAQ